MNEKAISKHLVNLEKQFANHSPVLQQAVKVFHELDQIEFELGLLDPDETTARKNSWWPIVSVVGVEAPTKIRLLNQLLGSTTQVANIHSASHKFTVFQQSNQATLTTLPGTALDVDHRLPFYNISRKLEQFRAGEGSKINAYLELKTLNSTRLKSRLFIETPDFADIAQNPARALLNQHVLEISDLVLVFTSVFDSDSSVKDQLIATIVAQQDANKFIYVIDHTDLNLAPERIQASIAHWRKRLNDLSLNTGQFIVLTQNEGLLQNQALLEIDQRLNHIDIDRTYRVLDTLDKSIRDISDVIMPEVSSALIQWKERCNFSTLIIIGFLVSILLFAEISMGVIDLLLDPLIGPLSLVILMILLIPIHLLISKLNAVAFVKQLQQRQKALNLTEDLSGLFSQSLTFWRMLLPITHPVGDNKKYRSRLKALSERVKNLVQALNDTFSQQTLTENTSFNTFTAEE